MSAKTTKQSLFKKGDLVVLTKEKHQSDQVIDGGGSLTFGDVFRTLPTTNYVFIVREVLRCSDGSFVIKIDKIAKTGCSVKSGISLPEVWFSEEYFSKYKKETKGTKKSSVNSKKVTIGIAMDVTSLIAHLKEEMSKIK